jgi:Haloacid Dehalogenase superfamily, subfamily IB, phosphoserine phosphatase-like/2,3-diketo-5-methylthio-1-phosphopentane phosphatase
MQKPLLVVFDFDHTIVDGNTDLIVQKLLPSDKITEDVKRLHHKDGWTAYMQEIFHLLHKNGVTSLQIQDAIAHIPATPGIKELVQLLYSRNVEVIIVSDANSVFIKDWLSYASLTHIFERVFTNPACYDKDGCLKIEMYHLQDFCKLSTKNLCKGHILDLYIAERAAVGVKFSKIAYVGDGRNDLCPSLRLSENDLVFPREGFLLDKFIRDMQNQEDLRLKAEVHTWETGSDIMKVISDYLDQK